MEKAKKQAPDVEVEEDFGEGYFAPYQEALWDLFEKPQSSLAAKVVSIVSVSSVLISTVGMCFNTFEWMQIKGKTREYSSLPLSLSLPDITGEPCDNPKLALVEACCISYFTIEFLFRFAGSPGERRSEWSTVVIRDLHEGSRAFLA